MAQRACPALTQLHPWAGRGFSSHTPAPRPPWSDASAWQCGWAAGQAGHLLANPREQLPRCCPQLWVELGAWRPSLKAGQSHRAVQGGCSASWQGSLGVVAPGPQGSLGLAVLCCVMSRRRQSQVLQGNPEQGLRWPWCSGARGCGRMRGLSPRGRAGLHTGVKYPT